MTPKQKHDAYIESLRADGRPLAAYDCPHCAGVIETLQPSADDEPYDSLTVCPHCEGKHVKAVWASGLVETVEFVA